MLNTQCTINCGGRLLSFDQARIMGILNINEDSFYSGSRQQSVEMAVKTAGEMLNAGADILDIGGMSSRPGAEIITAKTEQERVLPVIKAIKDNYPEAIISLDTVYAETARLAVEAGVGMINDISAGQIDPALFDALPELQVPYVLMHMRGRPENMQQQTDYADLITEIYSFLAEKNAQLTAAGVNDVIIDPGFGFGKTLEANYQLLNQLHIFGGFNRPILAGLSRKSMIWKALNINADQALNGTTALHVVALQQGASILRVHDVAAAKEVVQLIQLLKQNA